MDETSPLHGPEEAAQPDIAGAARSDDARIRHLERVPLFSGLTDDQLRRVAAISRLVEVPAESVLTRMGEPGDSFFILIDGRAAVQTQTTPASRDSPGPQVRPQRLHSAPPDPSRCTSSRDARAPEVPTARPARWASGRD